MNASTIHTGLGGHPPQRRATPVIEMLEPRQLLAARGLSAVYFDDANLTGISHSRVDATVNLNAALSPAPGIGADTFSVAWSGSIEPRFSETYTFHTSADDGIRLWVDGRLLIDTFGGGAFGATAQIALEAGKRHAIGLEYFDNTGNAVARLEWSSPSQGREVIPQSQLYPQLPQASSVKIMPLGDSITQGNTSHATYRYWLYRQMRYAGFNPDFTGSLQTHYAGGGQQGPPPYGHFDPDHEGHWGWRVDMLLPNLESWMRTQQPDIVLAHVGTNDIFQNQPNSQTISEIEHVIDTIRSEKPNVKIVLAELIPSSVQNSKFNDAIVDLNTRIRALAALRSTEVSPIVVVDQYTGFDPAMHTYDQVHPNEAGEKLMAQRWAAAMQAWLAPTAVEDEAVFGSDGADSFHVRLVAGGQQVLVWKNQDPGADPPAHTFATASLARLKLFGLGGDDVVTVDYSLGDPFGAGRLIEFDGGAGADSLVVVGGGMGEHSIDATSIVRAGKEIERGGVEHLRLEGGAYVAVSDLSGIALVLSNDAAIRFEVSQHLSKLSVSENAAVTMTASGQHVIRLSDLEISNGRIDLADNALVLDATAATKQMWHDTLFAWVVTARNGGPAVWQGSGLGTSLGTASMGLGLAINSTGGAPLLSMVAGKTVGPDAVIARLAGVGDANLDGRLTVADYLRMDRASARGLGGWFNGDFDYSGGPPDGTDYFLIDQAYIEPQPSATVEATVTSMASAPQPGRRQRGRRDGDTWKSHGRRLL